MVEQSFTLEELADEFGLTPRNARYYIEKILPPHHKKGRGKVARYGRDTWNCFAFIQKARKEKLTSTQIARVLAELSQEQIDRIAEGMEKLSVFSMLSSSFVEEGSMPPPMAAASKRARLHAFRSEVFHPMEDRMDAAEMSPEPIADVPRWRTLYSDDRLRIQHRGDADAQQREQVRKAAELIRSILEE